MQDAHLVVGAEEDAEHGTTGLGSRPPADGRGELGSHPGYKSMIRELIYSPELLGSLKLTNVWIFEQLIFG